MPDENYRNALREAKHQRDLLKDYLNNIQFGALLGRTTGSNYPGAEEADMYQSFSGLPQLFQELLFKLVLHQCPTNFQQISPTFFKIFKQITSLIIMFNNFNTNFSKCFPIFEIAQNSNLPKICQCFC